MFEDIVGTSEALSKVLRQLSKVASSDCTVLILGETGTGKELIARAIHKRSNRAERAFIAVNCAAIPASLIASELFGHEKGAFTGATQRRLGRFESANGGTIFLDEIGDLPPEIQIALLRVLQEREIERIGSNRSISVDVRVLAATHRDLNTLVAEGKFRQDLLYRLNVVPLKVPSLRERAADIPLLVEYFNELPQRRLKEEASAWRARQQAATETFRQRVEARYTEGTLIRLLESPSAQARQAFQEIEKTGETGFAREDVDLAKFFVTTAKTMSSSGAVPASRAVAGKRVSTFATCPPRNRLIFSWKNSRPDSTWKTGPTGPP